MALPPQFKKPPVKGKPGTKPKTPFPPMKGKATPKKPPAFRKGGKVC